MSAPMKKHRTSIKGNVLHIICNHSVYNIPKSVAEKYKVTGEGAVLADEFFVELDREYTKPGVLLRGLRVREGLSQTDFAKKIDVTQSDLSKMETGKRSIGKIIAKRIAKQFDIHYQSLLG